jgi:muramoyltetrapeptide carboxypeptidase
MKPSFLKPGDTIGLCAPARKVSREEMADGIAMLKSQGYEVLEAPNLYSEYHQFSGTEEQRAADFQGFLDNPEVKAIICARGGYGCVRFIDRIDFTEFKKHPKWIIGFSDVTVFHSHVIKHFGIATMHAPMLFNYSKDRINEEAASHFLKMLTGTPIRYQYSTPEDIRKFNRKGSCTGELVGGNLSILYSLAGSESDIDTTGKILFLEDLDEYLYHIDRMMQQLKRSGKIKGLKGLIIGGMNDMRDNTIPYGKTAEEIITEALEGTDFPVCFGFPAGHIPRNLSLIFGTEVTLEVTDEVTLTFE